MRFHVERSAVPYLLGSQQNENTVRAARDSFDEARLVRGNIFFRGKDKLLGAQRSSQLQRRGHVVYSPQGYEIEVLPADEVLRPAGMHERCEVEGTNDLAKEC